eukprot:2729885-Pyramimonas_sp.AAC.1
MSRHVGNPRTNEWFAYKPISSQTHWKYVSLIRDIWIRAPLSPLSGRLRTSLLDHAAAKHPNPGNQLQQLTSFGTKSMLDATLAKEARPGPGTYPMGGSIGPQTAKQRRRRLARMRPR